jgi:hypothetical protein
MAASAARLSSDSRHEVEDRPLRQSVVPRRQRIGLRDGRRGGQQARDGETGNERSALHANSLGADPNMKNGQATSFALASMHVQTGSD